MKTQTLAQVQNLRIYPEIRQEKTANGADTTHAGAIVLVEEVGGTKAIQLSPKQLDNLASIAGINIAGRFGWLTLSGLVGVMRSKALVSSVDHKAGDEYVTSDGTVGKYQKDYTDNRVEVIVLPETVTSKMEDKLLDNMLSKFGEVSIIGNTVLEPNLEGANK